MSCVDHFGREHEEVKYMHKNPSFPRILPWRIRPSMQHSGRHPSTRNQIPLIISLLPSFLLQENTLFHSFAPPPTIFSQSAFSNLTYPGAPGGSHQTSSPPTFAGSTP